MKANSLQKIVTMMLVEKLMSKDNLFVPMPAINKQHLLELKAQAGKIMLELAKKNGEDTSRMEERVAAAAEKAQAAKADDKDKPTEEKEVFFYGRPAEEIISNLKDIQGQLSSVSKGKPDNVREVRGVAKLGQEDGMYAFVVFTDDESVFDTAEAGKYPGQDDCGDPDCKSCNPDALRMSNTIQ